MKRTLLALAFAAAAGSTAAQTVTPPGAGGAPPRPSVGPGAVSTPPPTVLQASPPPASVLQANPPQAATPGVPPRPVGNGGAAVPTPPVGSNGAVTLPPPRAGSVVTPGVNLPNANVPSLSAPNTASVPVLPNAAGSASTVSRLQAQGYTNIQGLVRGSDGKWHGKAQSGSTMINVIIDAGGNITAH